MNLEQLLNEGRRKNASDLHLTVGMPPTLRIDGLLSKLALPLVEDADMLEVAEQLVPSSMRKTLKEHGEADFAVSFQGDTRIRCSVFRQQGHISMALRLLPMEIPTAESLMLPDVVIRQADKPRGLVLITGPTGSGKSSTLAALLHRINITQRRHIITLEDPIEYIHQPASCIINQREVGSDTESFASGLRAALREDPDVILVGEMRDLETISTAITAAETGHLVFATLHTKGVINTVDRIVDVFPSEQQDQISAQLADVLECVIGQTLLPKIGGGRRAAFEVMVGNFAVRNMIRQKKTFQLSSAVQTGKAQGMILLDEALIQLVQNGEVSAEEAAAVATDPEEVRKAKRVRY